MNLLDNEQNKKSQDKGKKIVLSLLVISVIALIFVIVMMLALKDSKPKKLGLNVNGENIAIAEGVVISLEDKKYISLQAMASYMQYDYLRGGYLEYIEDNKKCYLDNSKQIIGFEADKNQIYKTEKEANIDYEYYKLKNNIIQQNNILYIAIEDINVACNVICTFDEQAYKIKIYTPDYLSSLYQETFAQKNLTINNDIYSQKSMSYDIIVVNNEKSKLGVTDWNANTIIGNKYSTMQFVEMSQNFIVSDQGRYGIISKNGNVIAELKYDDIKLVNNSPVLYQVKLNNKYGIINESGKIVVDILYDKFGYNVNVANLESVLVIKDIDGKDGIVACNNSKYGIVNIKDGTVIMNCDVDKIYSKTDTAGNRTYYIELQNTEIDLTRYIDYINTTTVVRN